MLLLKKVLCYLHCYHYPSFTFIPDLQIRQALFFIRALWPFGHLGKSSQLFSIVIHVFLLKFILISNLVHTNLCETCPFKMPSLVVKTFAVRTAIKAQEHFLEQPLQLDQLFL